MPGPHLIAPDSQAAKYEGAGHPSRSADRLYHAVTIAAILLVLGSLWVF